MKNTNGGGIRIGLDKSPHTYKISLVDGKVIFTNDRDETIVISEEDSDLLRFYWRADAFGYPYRGFNGGREKLHKVIEARIAAQTKDGLIVDHIDRNKFNNSRDNLRRICHLGNSLNSNAMKTSKTGIRGVCFDKYRKRWKATMSGKYAHFDTVS